MSVQQANKSALGNPAGVKMAGHGVEIWTMRGGRIAVWDAAFNFKQAGKTSAMGII